jgi:carboxymethylenebutenolidase
MRAEWVDLTASDGHRFKAWRAEPSGRAKGAIVVIQEIFGVNHHIRDVTERFAREGYAAIAPALFDRYERDFDVGYGPEDRPKAMAIVPKIDIAKAVLDTDAARAAVERAGNAGIVGFCFGGVVAWLGATRLEFAAASCYYGGRIAAVKSETPHCPVIMHFGAKDAHIPLSMVEEIRQAQPGVPIYVYDADHGFSCDERESFDKAAHELAWSRTLKLFREHVG